MSAMGEDKKSWAEAVAKEIWVHREQGFLQTGKVTPHQGGGGGSVLTVSRSSSDRHQGLTQGRPILLHA